MKNYLLLLLFLFISCVLNAQILVKPGASPDDPKWVRLMYAEDADPDRVQAAHDAYYATHPWVKNEHTQYLKRWLRELETYEYQLRGPQLNEAERKAAAANEKAYLKQRKETALTKNNAADWTCIGPFNWDHDAAARSYAPGSAHVNSIEQCPQDADVLYAGTATAGVWRSADHGLNWTNITKDEPVNGVVGIEVHPTNCDELLAAMRGGIYRSTDGGATWAETGGADFRDLNLFSRDIKFVPGSTTDVWLASNRGLFLSTDRGQNWTLQESGNFLVVEFKPGTPATIYTVEKDEPANFTNFLRSTDGGATFAVQRGGWPQQSGADINPRSEIAVSAAAPNRVVATITGRVNGGNGLYGYYLSDDSGATWSFECCGPQPGGPAVAGTNINTMAWADDGHDDGGQITYNLSLAISPTDGDKIFSGATNLWVSDDGAASFTCPAKWSHPAKPNYLHADIHDLNYYANGELWAATDGGIFFSDDNGESFTRRSHGIAGTDFWGFGVGNNNDELMGGGAYHNGTLVKYGDVYQDGWLCTDGGDGVGGGVNPILEDRFYSDYNIKTMSDDRTVAPDTRGYALEPSWSYTHSDFDKIAWSADNYNVHYFPRGSKLYKTEDDNRTVTEIHDFGDKISDVEVAWTDQNIMYVTTYDGRSAIHKTVDGGLTWTDVTSPITAGSTASNDLAISFNDPDVIYAARMRWGDNDTKVQKSTDGGQTWTDITAPILNGETVTNIILQRGTQDRIYLGTQRAVYTSPDGSDNWELYATGLPAATRSRQLAISYRTGKLYNATNRSVWVTDLAVPSAAEVQLSVDKYYSGCARDTFYFADNSTVPKAGPFQWSFPGATYVSSLTERNPKVVFGAVGTYDVSLSVGGETQALTDFIEVGAECDPEPLAGRALSCGQGKQHFSSEADMVQNSNTLTISAWIKPNGTQDDYTGLVFGDEGGVGFNLSTNQQLGYHWPGGSTHWAYRSGLNVPADEWSFVAMVATPTSISFYLNDESVTRPITLSPADFKQVRIGNGSNRSDRNFRGEIDEVTVWNRSLTEDDLRTWRHLTKERQADPGHALHDPDLVAYYQFNETDNTVYDRVGVKHGKLLNGATSVISTAPVSTGSSTKLTVATGGVYDFTTEGVSLEFPSSGVLPDGEVVVTRLRADPMVSPATNIHPGAYWVINNYGTADFAELAEISFDGISGVDAADLNQPGQFVLYKRASNADDDDWGDYLARATAAEAGAKFTFGAGNGVTSFSQFVIGQDRSLPVEFGAFYLEVIKGRDVAVHWRTEREVNAGVYLVEHATDGRNFTELGVVEAADRAAGAAYEYLHEAAPAGPNYYRIRSRDAAGVEELTPIRQATITSPEAWGRVFPNPVRASSALQLRSVSTAPTVFQLFDGSGRLLRQTQFLGRAALRLPGLPAGSYAYRLVSAERVLAGQLVWLE